MMKDSKRKIYRQLITMALSMSLLLCLFGCGSKKTDQAESSAAQETQEETVSEAQSEEEKETKAETEKKVLPPSDATLNFPVFKEFELLTYEGREPVGAEIFKGHQLTFLNVWATFCGPCVREMPDLKALSDEYDPAVMQIIGLCMDVRDYQSGKLDDELMQEGRMIMQETGANYRQLVPDESFMNGFLYEISSVPTSFLINEEGDVLGIYIGSRSREDWKAIIEAYL